MKIKYSALVSEVRGKLNGSVASRNRSGAYLRNKVTPNNPQTSFQQGARALLSTFSQAWRSLTQAQRDAWNSAVSNFQRTNVFGDIVNPTGKNLYTLLNVNLDLAGASAISTPPLPVAIDEPTITAVSYEDPNTAALVEITVDNVESDQAYKVFATAPSSPGISNFNSKYRLIATLDAPATTALDVTTEYVARFGNPIEGQKAAFKVVPFSNTTGQEGVGSSEQAIATQST